MMRRMALLGIGLFLLIACNVSDDAITISGECETSTDCDDGECVDGECLDEAGGEFRESCSDDSGCVSGICLEAGGGTCSASCSGDGDCGTWTCRHSEDRGEDICQPDAAPAPPPGSASTLCGAGGVSEGEGYRLEHCLAPFDLPSSTLAGDNVNLESGAFRLITD